MAGHGANHGTHELGNGRKQIFLNAFDMYTPTHMNFGQWKNPADKGNTKRDLSYWVELAQLLERGGFLSLFIADTYGGYDTYEGNLDNSGIGNGCRDQTLAFGMTGSTAGELPFLLARRYSTLDHLTKGRTAWNIVTSWKKAAFKAIGLDIPVEHDERYLQADECLHADDAVSPDPEKDVYTGASKVRDIKHQGEYFKLESKFVVDPSPQRTPFLLFSSHAEGIFLGGFTPTAAAPKVADIHAEAEKKGRDPRSLRFFSMVVPIIGRTDEEANQKHQELKKYASTIGGLVFMSGITEIDLSQVPLDQELKDSDSISANKVHSQLANITGDPDAKWTPRMVAEPRQADIDGFTIVQTTAPVSFADIVELLVPEMRRRGVYPEASEEGLSIRERALGKGQRTLRDDHIGSTYKYSVYKEDPPYQTDVAADHKS
ncbi:xenobiotic compound monooxygenase, DszA family [Xylariales sp. AK1849]|nr:xenobiotic compound monooxygenase, DszA family [Xylariales sp. AK1849]